MVFTLGVILLWCTVTYVVPRTSVLGALLLTAYLGGAVATHVRAGSPLFSHAVFPIYLGTFLWVGLVLRVRGCAPFFRFGGSHESGAIAGRDHAGFHAYG